MKLWICRNKLGLLKLSMDKPKLSQDGTMWRTRSVGYILPFEEFPEVTFENSPMEVELKLIEKCSTSE